ncbi:hypothetical protein DNU06_16460 [Putridiphycobacter roseus]|uniref:Uncharacterized protein n=1 Tax=Putridiphycobacter roseus TaxID=2219161 RepID=A0A2W1MVC6_9FLAO|nr:hypothetical protein [Putridiphycobacter roseus]PZE15767.1 hypothetical protein DNU06_16460 [Putridiphycobacter roseus]
MVRKNTPNIGISSKSKEQNSIGMLCIAKENKTTDTLQQTYVYSIALSTEFLSDRSVMQTGMMFYLISANQNPIKDYTYTNRLITKA